MNVLLQSGLEVWIHLWASENKILSTLIVQQSWTEHNPSTVPHTVSEQQYVFKVQLQTKDRLLLVETEMH